MGINIVESDLPISKNSIGECWNCKKIRHIRLVQTYSAFTGTERGYYPFCFYCFGPTFHWTKTHLKESLTYETPHRLEEYSEQLEKLDGLPVFSCDT